MRLTEVASAVKVFRDSSELTHTALIPQGIQLSWPGQWPCVVKAGSGYSTGFLLVPVIVLLRVELSW